MNIKYVALTENAAEYILGVPESTLTAPFIKVSDRSEIAVESAAPGAILIFSRQDKPGCRYAVIDYAQLQTLPEESAREVFARILRTLRTSSRFPVRLPISWAEYHHHDLITFFALPWSRGGFRWIARVDESQGAVQFLRVTSHDDRVQLETFSGTAPPTLRAGIDRIIADKGRPLTEGTPAITFADKVDFDAIGASAISQSWTIEMWITRLTPDQLKIKDLPPSSNIRIVGPAGSGKTLTLCIRALSQARESAARGKSIRVLFATHSWAMAERVDETLRILNGGEISTDITVYPLLSVLGEVIGRSYTSGLSVLGQDSTEGRRLQFELLSESLQSVSGADRTVIAAQGVSQQISEALKVGAKNAAWTQVVEDLYEEINGVLLAEGIMPGDRSKEEEYLSENRSDELPPFSTRGDRGLVLLVYKDFVSRLRDWGYVTSDQLVSDAIKVLETFSWSVKRESDGYDIVFVDELQLFDAQERFALTLLTRSIESAGFVTAEDPSQGVFSAISSKWRRDVPTRTKRESIELAGNHRFSPGILRFIQFLYQSFPLNAPLMPIDQQQELISDTPELHRVSDREACLRVALTIFRSISASLAGDERLAMICLNGESVLIAGALQEAGQNVTIIGSLDDVERLSYSRRSVVVGEWQFLGGTQFSHVVVISSLGSVAKSSFGRLKELTALYVATSRAARVLRLVVGGRAHPELQNAVAKKLLSSIDDTAS